MKMLESVAFPSPWRPFASRSASVHLAGVVVVSTAFAMAGVGLVSWERIQTQRVQIEVAALERTMALPSVSAEHAAAQPALEWPLRESVDEVIQQAGQSAVRLGVNIRSLSVSHQSASPAVWGRVSLQVSAGGSYSALKAWQADVSQRFPALAVQNLRMQATAGAAAGLESQWTWVLYARD
ncbi:GspMb/PilO family protein [Hydrogenophaga sp.]|uniref:GspMb/PilO family protein n=1 Tax=Hydrogenophaga sp. TaxID=1904254 RepID=UPI00286E7AC3|nr:GspMb/PilO family protein [Hydrogenophaga sp.]